MRSRSVELFSIVVAVTYLVLFGWAIVNLTYDMWGALVVAPPLTLMGVLALRRMFPGDLRPIATIMSLGIVIKFAGAAARYWVGFEAYAGGIDAQRYHDYAVARATAVWSGDVSILSLIPERTGTPFMEDVTAIIYLVTGASKLGGFFVFGWIAFMGTAWFVKAACVAIPGLLRRRYAVLCILAPSVVYWPSSIGKEAWMFLTLGVATYGIANLVTRRATVPGAAYAAVGLLGAALVRPHIAALWIAGALPALLVAVFVKMPDRETRNRLGDRIIGIGALVLAVAGLSVAGGATLSYLNFDDESGDVTATSIFAETTRRTEQAGSNFSPPSIANPVNWPYASVRTLTRPLLIEARGSGPLLSALEMSALIGLALISWRRLANVPRALVKTPFVTFAVTVLFFGSLAFASFANLGILTRQRTLIFPFLLLLVCLPTRAESIASIGDDDAAAVPESRTPVDVGARDRTRNAIGDSFEMQDLGRSSGWPRSDSRPNRRAEERQESGRNLWVPD